MNNFNTLITREEADILADEKIPQFITYLIKLKQNYMIHKTSEQIPPELMREMDYTKRLIRIWDFRLNNVNNNQQITTQVNHQVNQPNIQQSNQSNQLNNDDTNSDDSSTSSISDVEYVDYQQDKIEKLLKLGSIELEYAKSSKGFHIKSSPIYSVSE